MRCLEGKVAWVSFTVQFLELGQLLSANLGNVEGGTGEPLGNEILGNALAPCNVGLLKGSLLLVTEVLWGV